MQKLLEYQKSFYKALFTNDSYVLEQSIGKIDELEERLRIYSNNIFSSLKDALKDDFPISNKILGEENFNRASFEFIRNFPPTSGCLLDYGQTFPIFLEVFFPDFPYIKDISQIEWAQKEIYYKRDTTPLDPSTISSIPPEQYTDLTFDFPEAAFFLESRLALQEVWDDVENNSQNIKIPHSALSFSLIIRPRFKIQHYWLSNEEFNFFIALYEGQTLGEAYENAILINPEFNLSEALRVAMAREYFTKGSLS